MGLYTLAEGARPSRVRDRAYGSRGCYDSRVRWEVLNHVMMGHVGYSFVVAAVGVLISRRKKHVRVAK